MKEFESQDLACLNQIVGKKFKDIFLQPVADILSDNNMIVINFEGLFSIHCFCFVRIIVGGELLLTSSDEYFNCDYQKLSSDEYNENESYKKSLLYKNCKAVKSLLKKAKVTNYVVNETADVIIYFDNNSRIEILPDCLYESYEYYRILDLNKDHYVITFENKKLMFDFSCYKE